MKKVIIIIFVLVLAGLGLFWLLEQKYQFLRPPLPVSSVSISPSGLPTQKPAAFSEPIQEFKTRIIKKPFGIYITPENSPVQPERFRGYHTGTDVEYADVLADVPVYAIYDGKIIFSQRVSGYGGVIVLRLNLNGSDNLAIYGHLRPSLLPEADKEVMKGEQIGVLGTGFSSETDGEREHLHFAILKGTEVDLRGYVSSQAALNNWLDPLTFY